MQATITANYGPADILDIQEVPTPVIGDQEVLVEVHATPVTAGDLRLRAADFPSVSVIPGRLMMGVLRPRNSIQGSMFAGRVVEIGRAVTRYAVGDEVFGSTDHGAYAEYLSVPEDGPMTTMPAGLSFEKAAAVPYGAWTALHFLRDLARVESGERVLIVGASGGVGRFAVQLAKHMGAEVTAVCSSRSFELVRELGADHVIDYASEDFSQNGQRYDVIFDIAGASSFGHSRSSLNPKGRYLTLYLSVGVLVQMAWTSMLGGRRALFDVAFGDRRAMEDLRELLEQGAISAQVAARFRFEEIAKAHAEAETGRPLGTVVVTVAPPTPLQAVAC